MSANGCARYVTTCWEETFATLVAIYHGHVASFLQLTNLFDFLNLTSGPLWTAVMDLPFFPCNERGKVYKSVRRLNQHSAIHRRSTQLANPVQGFHRDYHPLLNGNHPFSTLHNIMLTNLQGAPCDHGNFLPLDSPPTPPPPKSSDDWTPFASRAGFELAEILYLKAHLSQSIINQLLDIWSATLVPHGDLPPIADHQELHAQIDAIGLGNVPWKSYTAQYQWLLPKSGPIPEWMKTEYQLWYRDPRQVIHHILANPEFASGIDYAPHCDFQDGKQQYRDFMSGDWSWEQCVCRHGHIYHSLLTRL